MNLQAGEIVISSTASLRQYGVGRVLMIKNGVAKVEYSPSLFSEPPLYAHTKLLKIEESEKVPDPLERAMNGQWEKETWRFDLRQIGCVLDRLRLRRGEAGEVERLFHGLLLRQGGRCDHRPGFCLG